MPLFGDQPFNAGAIAASGAGVASSLDQIGKRLRLVLDDERYRTTARSLADEMRSHPPVDAFFDRYEAWLAQQNAGHSPERFRHWALTVYTPGPARSELTWRCGPVPARLS